MGNILKQVKVSVRAETASAFKAACDAEGLSMASVLTQFMGRYGNTPVVKNGYSFNLST
jgi:hypothetical protein